MTTRKGQHQQHMTASLVFLVGGTAIMCQLESLMHLLSNLPCIVTLVSCVMVPPLDWASHVYIPSCSLFLALWRTSVLPKLKLLKGEFGSLLSMATTSSGPPALLRFFHFMVGIGLETKAKENLTRFSPVKSSQEEHTWGIACQNVNGNANGLNNKSGTIYYKYHNQAFIALLPVYHNMKHYTEGAQHRASSLRALWEKHFQVAPRACCR